MVRETNRTYTSRFNKKAWWVSGRGVFRLVSLTVGDEGFIFSGREWGSFRGPWGTYGDAAFLRL